jgi:hypothetical protein
MEQTNAPSVESGVAPIKLAKASINFMDLGPAVTMGGGFRGLIYPDKLQIPTKWPDIVNMIRFYYERDPIASTVVNKSVEIGINEIHNNQGDADEEVMEVYDSLLTDLHMFSRDMAREYLLPGMVIPEVSFASKEITLKSGEKKVFTLPENMWIRDAATIQARKTPIPNRINYYVEVDSDTMQFIQTKGQYSDGTKDTETYNLLVAKFPEFVNAVRKGLTSFKLDNPYSIIIRSPIAGKPYPTPYLFAVLESLLYKRTLRKMDFSVAARVISAIQLVTLGSDQFPITENDAYQIDDIKQQMRWEGRDTERVFQMFGNHTLKISWVYPDTAAMLDKSKYDAVNQDIMFGLGFPRILLSGETEKSATSNPEFAMFSPAASLGAMREDLMIFINKLYKDIADQNGFSKYPTLEFASLNLYDVEKMGDIIDKLLSKASLSKTSALKAAGFSFEDEIRNIVRERQTLQDNQVPEFLPQPFSPQPQVPGQNPVTAKPTGNQPDTGNNPNQGGNV